MFLCFKCYVLCQHAAVCYNKQNLTFGRKPQPSQVFIYTSREEKQREFFLSQWETVDSIKLSALWFYVLYQNTCMRQNKQDFLIWQKLLNEPAFIFIPVERRPKACFLSLPLENHTETIKKIGEAETEQQIYIKIKNNLLHKQNE